MGILRPSAASTKTRFIGCGFSDGLAKIFLACECSMAHCISHVLQAVQRSGWTKIRFIACLLSNDFLCQAETFASFVHGLEEFFHRLDRVEFDDEVASPQFFGCLGEHLGDEWAACERRGNTQVRGRAKRSRPRPTASG